MAEVRLTEAQVRALRALAARDQPNNDRRWRTFGSLRTRGLARMRLVSRGAGMSNYWLYSIEDAGRRWLAEHGHAD